MQTKIVLANDSISEYLFEMKDLYQDRKHQEERSMADLKSSQNGQKPQVCTTREHSSCQSHKTI